MAGKFQQITFKRDNATFEDTFTTNIPNWLFTAIAEQAAIEGVGKNAIVKRALREYLAHRKPEAAKAAEEKAKAEGKGGQRGKVTDW